MTCNDRQLSEAQRQEGYDNLRTGVVRAIRPFQGAATIPNIVDYLNREVFPAVKQTRAKVNDTYLQATDNAPSGNPLQFYFSTNTANADPTTGRARLNQATQETATVIRVSETNARLMSVAPWLDVMAGGATSPLGVLTLTAANDPSRFIRFDLSSMTDQGAYWDLTVSPIESSHDNPFVDDTPITIGFIPGVGGNTPATVPPSSVTPMSGNTVLGNPTATTAAPVEIPIGTNSVLGRVAGNIVAAQVVADQVADNAITDAKLRDSTALSVIGRASNTSGDPADITATAANQILRVNGAGTALVWSLMPTTVLPQISDGHIYINTTGGLSAPAGRSIAALAGLGLSALLGPNYNLNVNGSTSIIVDAGSDEVQRAELAGGDVTAPQNSNVLTVVANAITDGKFRQSAALSVVGRAANSTGNVADISATPASGAVLRESGSAIGWGTIATGGLADDSVTDAKLRDSAALSVIGRAANSVGNPGDIVASANDRVLARRSDLLVFTQVVNEDIAAGTIQLDRLAGISANTVIGNPTASTANPTAIAIGTNTVLGRVGANIVAAQLVNAQITDATIANAKLGNMTQATVKGRASGAGTGAPQDLTGSEVRAIIAGGSINEVEETGAGPHADYAVTHPVHIMGTNAAGQFSGVVTTGAGLGAELIFSHQGSGYTELLHNVTSTGANRLFNGRLGKNLRIFDNEVAIYRLLDTSVGGGSNTPRWELVFPSFPFAQASDNAAGDIAMFNGTNMVIVQPTSTSIVRNGTTWERAALTGDVTAAQNSNATTIANDAVSNAKLRDSGACSVIGRSANSAGDPADISAAANNRVLVRRSDALSFEQIVNAEIADGTIALGKLAGITANTVIGNNTASTANPVEISVGTNTVLGRVGGNIVAAQLATGQVADAAITDAKISNRQALSLFGRATNSAGVGADITSLSGSDSVMRESGGTINWGTIATGGIANAAVTLAKMANLAQSTIIGRAEGAGTGVPTALTPTQVVSIIDGESPTWAGTTFATNTSAGVNIAAGTTVTLSASTGVVVGSPLEVQNVVTFQSRITKTAALANSTSGGIDNLNIGNVSTVIFSGTSPVVSGMVPAADGQEVRLVNSSGTDVSVLLESASSSAANRFGGVGTSRAIKPGELALAWYDGTADRWRLLCRDDSDL